MQDWKPMESVAMVAVIAATVVSLAFLYVWYYFRSRQIDFSACTSDDQAARILGESLAKVNVSPEGVEEVMAAFARMDSASKRSTASAVAGLVGATDSHMRRTIEKKLREIVRGFSETRH